MEYIIIANPVVNILKNFNRIRNLNAQPKKTNFPSDHLSSEAMVSTSEKVVNSAKSIRNKRKERGEERACSQAQALQHV